MNVSLWILQVLLALHTAMGALWKWSASEQAVPSLRALPHALWLGLSGVEVLCAVGFLAPLVSRRLGRFAAYAALGVAAEMALFSAVHLASGQDKHGELAYWGVVALLCGFVAVGRLKLSPLGDPAPKAAPAAAP